MAEKTPASQKATSYGPEDVHSVGETSVEKDPFSFLWVVNNFSDLKKLTEVKSPVFRGGHKNTYGWQLTINPSKKFDDVEYCSLYVSLVDFGKGPDSKLPPRPVRATFQMSMLNADGQPAVESAEEASLEFEESRRVWGCQKFISSSSLVNLAWWLVVNDTLKIHCKVVVLGVKQKLSKSAMPPWNPLDNQRNASFKNSFARDFGKMFRESIGTDVTILTGRATFQAHTFLLKARSSVFAAMFNTNMIENETKTLVISDFDEVVVEEMLEHLYTGKTDSMDELAPELLKIAEKYDLTGLKEDCVYELGDKLNLENAGEVLVLAQTHNVPDLKARAIEFINLNKDKLLRSKSFKDAVKLADAGTLVELYFSQL